MDLRSIEVIVLHATTSTFECIAPCVFIYTGSNLIKAFDHGNDALAIDVCTSKQHIELNKIKKDLRSLRKPQLLAYSCLMYYIAHDDGYQCILKNSLDGSSY